MKMGIVLICIGSIVILERGVALAMVFLLEDTVPIGGWTLGVMLFAILPIIIGILRIRRARQ